MNNHHDHGGKSGVVPMAVSIDIEASPDYIVVQERGRTYYVQTRNIEAFDAAGCSELQRVALCDFMMEGDRIKKNRYVNTKFLLEHYLGKDKLTVRPRSENPNNCL